MKKMSELEKRMMMTMDRITSLDKKLDVSTLASGSQQYYLGQKAILEDELGWLKERLEEEYADSSNLLGL